MGINKFLFYNNNVRKMIEHTIKSTKEKLECLEKTFGATDILEEGEYKCIKQDTKEYYEGLIQDVENELEKCGKIYENILKERKNKKKVKSDIRESKKKIEAQREKINELKEQKKIETDKEKRKNIENNLKKENEILRNLKGKQGKKSKEEKTKSLAELQQEKKSITKKIKGYKKNLNYRLNGSRKNRNMLSQRKTKTLETETSKETEIGLNELYSQLKDKQKILNKQYKLYKTMNKIIIALKHGLNCQIKLRENSENGEMEIEKINQKFGDNLELRKKIIDILREYQQMKLIEGEDGKKDIVGLNYVLKNLKLIKLELDLKIARIAKEAEKDTEKQEDLEVAIDYIKSTYHKMPVGMVATFLETQYNLKNVGNSIKKYVTRGTNRLIRFLGIKRELINRKDTINRILSEITEEENMYVKTKGGGKEVRIVCINGLIQKYQLSFPEQGNGDKEKLQQKLRPWVTMYYDKELRNNPLLYGLNEVNYIKNCVDRILGALSSMTVEQLELNDDGQPKQPTGKETKKRSFFDSLSYSVPRLRKEDMPYRQFYEILIEYKRLEFTDAMKQAKEEIQNDPEKLRDATYYNSFEIRMPSELKYNKELSGIEYYEAIENIGRYLYLVKRCKELQEKRKTEPKVPGN